MHNYTHTSLREKVVSHQRNIQQELLRLYLDVIKRLGTDSPFFDPDSKETLHLALAIKQDSSAKQQPASNIQDRSILQRLFVLGLSNNPVLSPMVSTFLQAIKENPDTLEKKIEEMDTYHYAQESLELTTEGVKNYLLNPKFGNGWTRTFSMLCSALLLASSKLNINELSKKAPHSVYSNALSNQPFPFDQEYSVPQPITNSEGTEIYRIKVVGASCFGSSDVDGFLQRNLLVRANSCSAFKHEDILFSKTTIAATISATTLLSTLGYCMSYYSNTTVNITFLTFLVLGLVNNTMRSLKTGDVQEIKESFQNTLRPWAHSIEKASNCCPLKYKNIPLSSAACGDVVVVTTNESKETFLLLANPTQFRARSR
jgi:hypothetical protein